MTSFEIEDVKEFMSDLLVKEKFDSFQLHEMDIESYCKLHIDGKIIKKWYNTEEYEQLADKEYTLWGDSKKLAYEFIKGKKTPTSIKLVLALNDKKYAGFIASYGLESKKNQVNKLYLNIKYEEQKLYITTGVAYNEFTLDKSIENEWDSYIKNTFS